MNGTLSEAADEALIRKIADGNAEAFDVLASRHARSIYSLALQLTSNRMAAEDILQETLLGAWSAARNYDASKSRIRSWLLHIAAHTAFNSISRRNEQEFRIRRRRAQAGSARLVSLPAEGTLEEQESLVTLRALLGQLPDPDRQLVALYYGGELSQLEISRLLGLPQRTVSRRLALALEQLRAGLKKAGLVAAAGDGGPLGEAVRGAWPIPSDIRLSVALPRTSASVPRPHSGKAAGLTPVAARGGLLRRSWAIPALLGLACSGILCVTTGFFFSAGGRVERTPPPADPQRPVHPPAPVSPVDPSRRFHRAWNFDSADQLRDFQVAGAVRHLQVPDAQGGGCLEMDRGDLLKFTVPDPGLPLRITLSVRRFGIKWVEEAWPTSVRVLGVFNLRDLPSPQDPLRSTPSPQDRPSPGALGFPWVPVRYLVTRNSIEVQDVFGRKVILCEEIRAPLTLRVGQWTKIHLDDLVMEQLPSEEIPDQGPFQDAFRRLSPGLQAGKCVPVPWLGSPGQRAVYFSYSGVKGWQEPTFEGIPNR